MLAVTCSPPESSDAGLDCKGCEKEPKRIAATMSSERYNNDMTSAIDVLWTGAHAKDKIASTGKTSLNCNSTNLNLLLKRNKKHVATHRLHQRHLSLFISQMRRLKTVGILFKKRPLTGQTQKNADGPMQAIASTMTFNRVSMLSVSLQKMLLQWQTTLARWDGQRANL